jgi:hypothetical protein
MAKKFLTDLNLFKNELQNARIQNLASAPSSPVEGQFYYDTVDSAIKYYDGAAWQSLAIGGSVDDAIANAIAALDLANTYDAKGAAATAETNAKSYADGLASNYDAAGTAALEAAAAQANAESYADTVESNAATYSDTAAATAYSNAASYADGLASNYDAAGAAASAQSNAATYTDGEISTALTTAQGYADAAEANAAAYTDNAVSGLAWKQAVNLLATSDVALTGTTETLVIDGHSALDSTDDGVYRLLLTGQTDDSENGIYVYGDNGSTYTLTRPADADTYQELDGAAVYVKEGTQYGSTSWVQGNHYISSFAGQSWTQFSGQGSVTAGTGITVDGLEVSVNRTTVDTWYDAAGSAAAAGSASNAYADSLASNYDAAGSAATAEQNAKNFTNTTATGLSSDIVAAEASALADAKDYTNTVAEGLQTDIDDAVANIFATSEGSGLEVVEGVLNVDLGTGLDFDGTGQVKIDRTTVDTWYDAAGAATSAQSNAASYTDNAVSDATNTITTAYQTYANTKETNITAAYEAADSDLSNAIGNVASDLSDAETQLGTDIGNALSDAKDYTNTVASGLTSDIGNVVTDYQAADNAVVSSVTAAYTDADNVVLSTLRSEISSAAAGLDVKNSARVATTENITLTNVSVVDGITLVEGDRVLVKNQSAPEFNGIYELSDGDLVRTQDADAPSELNAGTFVFVEEGTHADSGFVVSSDNPITIGTDPITWVQFSGAGQIIAGNGINKSAETLSVVAGSGITVDGSGVSIDSTYAGQTSIDTVGTITTGTWNGSTIDVAHGGTGATSLTGYVKGSGTDALTASSTIPGSDISGDISGSAGNVTGTVAIANGGTGATTAAGARSNLAATTKYSANNTSLTPSAGVVTWTVTHSIGTLDVTVQIRDLADNALVEADVVITSTNVVTISWISSATVSADSYRVVVVG